MFERAMLMGTALIFALPFGAAGQDWRDVTSFRQRAAESSLDVHVRYGAGELFIAPSADGELYRAALHYDADIFDPVTEYLDGRLEVGVEGGDGVKLRNTKSGELRLSLSPDVPLDLDLDFGAVAARIDLSGLRVQRMDIETGASETELSFLQPNPMDCEDLDITMGAASFEAQGLGNANCRRLGVEGGVGEISLDFSGEWRRNMHADITVALGSVTLRVPENVGVHVEKSTFLAHFDGRRFHRRDGDFYSDNWDRAERRLTVQLEGAFGSFDVRWIGPTVVTP